MFDRIAAKIESWAIGTAFRGPGLAAESGETVLVAITHARLNRRGRRSFDRYTRLVFESLDAQPGYVGGDIRREVVGRQAWTITAWVDEDALGRFVRSQVHQEAIRSAGQSLAVTRFRRLLLSAKELPIGWDRALELLESEGSG